MIKAQQQFTVTHSLSKEKALAYTRQPHSLLHDIRFIKNLVQEKDILNGVFCFHIPVIGEVTLPFQSQIIATEKGTQLQPMTLQENAWISLAGEAIVTEQNITFEFECAAFFSQTTEKWGTQAFSKMIDAAAQRTLLRIMTELPPAMQRNINNLK